MLQQKRNEHMENLDIFFGFWITHQHAWNLQTLLPHNDLMNTTNCRPLRATVMWLSCDLSVCLLHHPNLCRTHLFSVIAPLIFEFWNVGNVYDTFVPLLRRSKVSWVPLMFSQMAVIASVHILHMTITRHSSLNHACTTCHFMPNNANMAFTPVCSKTTREQ